MITIINYCLTRGDLMYDGLIKKISNKINLIVMPYLSKDYFFNIEEYDEILIFRLYNKKDEIYSIICDVNKKTIEPIINKNINKLRYQDQNILFNSIEGVEDEFFKAISEVDVGTFVFNDRVEIVIPIDPVTKKNSPRIRKRKSKDGKKYNCVIPSEAFENYQNDVGYFLKDLEINKKVNIKSLYFTRTRRRIDLNNLHSACHDILVHYHLLKDDNSNIIVSTNGSRVIHDKGNPRTEITIKLV